MAQYAKLQLLQRNGSIPDANTGDEAREFSDASWTVANLHDKPTQSPVSGKSSVQASSEHRRVDVAATQWNDNPSAIP